MEPPVHYRDRDVEIRKACVGPWENNTYVVACRASKRSVIVDAAAEPDTIARLAAGTTPTAILTTHGHSDHIGAARAVAAAFSIPFRMHPADTDIAGIEADLPVGTDPITIGTVAITPVHTPGHTPGSICFTVGAVVLTGDTLFPGGPGATRGAGSSFEQIIASIEQHLFALSDGTLVMPGHGLDTTIGEERPNLASWVERGW